MRKYFTIELFVKANAIINATIFSNNRCQRRMFSHKLIVMAKSSTRRVILYIIGKEEDASGWQTFSYEKLGEVTENIRTFAPAFRTHKPKPTPTQYAHNP